MPTTIRKKAKVLQTSPQPKIPGPVSEGVEGAVRSAFPWIDGTMHVRRLYVLGDAARFRVNWFREGANGHCIRCSKFVIVSSQDDRPRVRDATVGESTQH